MPYTIPNAEIFAPGVHKGRQWTLADCQSIYRNFQKFSVPQGDRSPLIRVPVVLGHEEDAKLSERTDTPAHGWAATLAIAPTGLLTSNLDEIDPAVAEWVKVGKIRNVSAEIYEDFVDDAGNHHGPTLKRVSLLGGTLPEVKSLNELPKPTAKLSDAVPSVSINRVFKFAETAMDREQMLEMIKGLNLPLSQEFLDSLSDEQVAQLLKDLGPKPPAEGDPNKPADQTNLSDPNKPPATPPGNPPANPQPPAGQPQQVVFKYSDVQQAVAAALKPIQAKIDASDRQAAARLNAEKAARIKTECDKALASGRLRPADRPAVEKRLARADAVNRVVKFGDDPKAEPMTEFDAQVAELHAGPVVVKFGDTMPDPAAKSRFDAARDAAKARHAARSGGKSLEEKFRMVRPAQAAMS